MHTISSQWNIHRHSRYVTTFSTITVLFGFLTCSSTSWAFGGEDNGDFLLFPRVHVDQFSNAPQQLDLDDEELSASASAFYSKNSGQFRFLGEFFVSQDEADIERLQIGWSLNDQATTWAGRFHTPVGFWNQEYQHGAYLQASVSRPSVVEFEDDGGILPTHMTGLLLEGNKSISNGNWDYSVGIGYGATITDKGMEAVDIIDPSVSGLEPTMSAMLSYAPDEFGPLKFGVFYLASTLGSELVSISDVEQNVAGAYFHGEWPYWKITTAYFALSNRVRATAGTSDSDFSAGYVQVDHMFDGPWTVFGRIEDSAGINNDPYLALFPGFITSRSLIGARYDVIKNHALTIEYGNVDVGMLNESYNHFSFQWSALFQ